MITSQKIKELRIKTGAGMMDCKTALENVDGDLESAIDWLRKKGINTAQKKSLRDASEGLITISKKSNIASIVEINSETDFVARNQDFQKFCKLISDTVIESNSENIESLNKYRIKKSSKNVSEELTDMISKVGENLIIKRFKLLETSNCFIQSYVHNSVNQDSGKIGVLLSLKCDNVSKELEEFSKNLCMHIAATEPKSISEKELDPEIIKREKDVYFEQLSDSNKSKEIIEKIITGKINKFFEEVCLLDQYFVMENKVKIKDYIDIFCKQNNSQISIEDFVIYKVGETF